MIKLTEKPVCFEKIGCYGHLYRGFYPNGVTAIVAGKKGEIGALSVNLVELSDQLGKDEFFVRLYGAAEYLNDPCMESGLFEIAGDEFTLGPYDTPFQKWRLKK